MPPLIDLFSIEINSIIDKYRDEGLTVGEAIGAIEIIKLDLWDEQKNNDCGIVAEWGRKDFDGVLFSQLVKNLATALQQSQHAITGKSITRNRAIDISNKILLRAERDRLRAVRSPLAKTK
jgi:hypothetical protein